MFKIGKMEASKWFDYQKGDVRQRCGTRAARFTTENDGRSTLLFVYTARSEFRWAPRIRSVCKRPLSLPLGRCQSGKRLAPVSKKKKGRRKEEGFLPLPATLPRCVSGDGKRSFVGYLISTGGRGGSSVRRVLV